jgi:small subunit ribosomal protein S11
MMHDINKLEIVMRGFGAGREAVTKAILGAEGKNIRDRISAVLDATRLKIGGTRSPKPRRLG